MKLSYSQIKTLFNNPKDRYIKYVEKKRDPFFAKSYTVGKGVHRALENGIDKEKGMQLILDEYAKALDDGLQPDSIEDMAKDLEKYLENAKKLPEFYLEGEKEKYFEIDVDGLTVRGYIDLETDDCVIDYKTAGSYTNPENDRAGKLEEYKRQCRIYSYATKKDAKIVEIGKAKNSKICPEGYQVFEFPYSTENDKEVEKLLSKAKKRIDIYSNMDVEEIPAPLSFNL